MAVADPSAAGNPVAFDAEQYGALCARAVRGALF
jgi:hypothetical protein